MKSHKLNTLILIAFLSFLASALFVLKILVPTDKKIIQTPKPNLTLLKNFPSPGPHKTAIPGEAIMFTFDQKINPETISFKVSPAIDLKWRLDDSQTTLYIYPPNSPWEENRVYHLTISENLSSTEGNRLTQELVYEYQYEFSEIQE